MNIESFLNGKENKENYINHLNGKNKKNIIIRENKENEKENLDNELILSSSELTTFTDDYLKEVITNKRHREILSNLIKEKEYNLNSIEYFINGYNDFVEYKHLMKNDNIIFEDYFKKENEKSLEITVKNFENFNDDVQKTIIKNKANKLKKRIFSKKNEHLCNEETNQLLLEMSQLEFSKEELQDNIGKKINAFSHSIELNGALMNLIEIKKGWSPELFIKKINEANLIENDDYIIHSNENNKLMIEVKTFKASSVIGSKMWCITRESEMFDNYKNSKGHTDFLFIYDFNKKPSDDFSMVAALLNAEHMAKELYTKSDVEFNKTNNDNKNVYHKEIKEKIKRVQPIEILKRILKGRKEEIEEQNKYSSFYDEYKDFSFEDEKDLKYLIKNITTLDYKFKYEDLMKLDYLKKTNIKNDIHLIKDENVYNAFKTELLFSTEKTINNYSNNDLRKLLEDEKMVKLFTDVNEQEYVDASGIIVEKLLNLKKYEEVLFLIEKEEYKASSKNRFNPSHSHNKNKNALCKMFDDNDFLNYIKENNKQDELINTLMNETNNRHYLLMDSMIISKRSINELNNLKREFPELENHKLVLNELENNYKLKYNILMVDPQKLEMIDFKNGMEEFKTDFIEDVLYFDKAYWGNSSLYEKGFENIQANTKKLMSEIKKEEPDFYIPDEIINTTLGKINLKNLGLGVLEKEKRNLYYEHEHEKIQILNELSIKNKIDLTDIIYEKVYRDVCLYLNDNKKPEDKFENKGLEYLLELGNNKHQYKIDFNKIEEKLNEKIKENLNESIENGLEELLQKNNCGYSRFKNIESLEEEIPYIKKYKEERSKQNTEFQKMKGLKKSKNKMN